MKENNAFAVTQLNTMAEAAIKPSQHKQSEILEEKKGEDDGIANTKSSNNLGFTVNMGFAQETSGNLHLNKNKQWENKDKKGQYAKKKQVSSLSMRPKVNLFYEQVDAQIPHSNDLSCVTASTEQKINNTQEKIESFQIGLKAHKIENTGLEVKLPGFKSSISAKQTEQQLQVTSQVQANLIGVKYEKELVSCENGRSNKVTMKAEANIGATFSSEIALEKNKTNKDFHISYDQQSSVGMQGKLTLAIEECSPAKVSTDNNGFTRLTDVSFFSKIEEQKRETSGPSCSLWALGEDSFPYNQVIYLEVNQDKTCIRASFNDTVSNNTRTEMLPANEFVPEFNAYIRNAWQHADSEQRQYLAGLSQEISLLGIPGIQPFSLNLGENKHYRDFVQSYLFKTEEALTQNHAEQGLTLYKPNANSQDYRARALAIMQRHEEKASSAQPQVNKIERNIKYNYPATPANLSFGTYGEFFTPPPIVPSVAVTQPAIHKPRHRTAPPPLNTSSPLRFSNSNAAVDFTPRLVSNSRSSSKSSSTGGILGVAVVFVRFSFTISRCCII